ncbi:hypothetical protein [Streptomyces pilosus]|uniref:hypothetical protein n=1 Tax=Streptomyces pilosus TaxID=28893 RepID=UPI003641A2F5
MTTELTQDQRDRRWKQAHTAIRNALIASWPDWRRTGRRPNFTLAADNAMDGLGDLAAEILADGTMLKALDIRDGVVTLETEPAREILLTLVAAMRTMLDSYGAQNYLETEIVTNEPSVALDLQDGQNPADSYTVTIQRRQRPTPHEFRQQAEARVAELERELAHTQPRRGDQVEAWLKAQRDRYDRDAESSEFWHEFDRALDQYRLHADMGVPLDGHVCEARVVGDCECLEPADG